MAFTSGRVQVESSLTEEELVRNNIPLVHYAVAEVAAKIPRHVSRDDLISAGMAGLAQAARNFDAERGINFDRYASTRIRGALLDELRSCDWASRSVRSRARQISTAVEDLQTKLGRAPSTEEIASHLNMESSAVEAVTEDVHRAVVLNYDSMVGDGGGADEVLPADQRSPDAIILERERQSYLHDSIDALPERLKAVVEGYFFEERPMKELADELGVTESRVSQMRAEALELLKDGMNSQLNPEVILDDDRPTQRIARRKAAYFEAIAQNSDFKTRVSASGAARRGRFGASALEQAEAAEKVRNTVAVI